MSDYQIVEKNGGRELHLDGRVWRVDECHWTDFGICTVKYSLAIAAADSVPGVMPPYSRDQIRAMVAALCRPPFAVQGDISVRRTRIDQTLTLLVLTVWGISKRTEAKDGEAVRGQGA